MKVSRVHVLYTSIADDNLLNDLRQEMFTGIRNLRQLSMQTNYITSLTPNVFRHLKGLRGINLSDNFISILESRSLGGPDRLEEIHLAQNRIEWITRHAFRGMQDNAQI